MRDSHPASAGRFNLWTWVGPALVEIQLMIREGEAREGAIDGREGWMGKRVCGECKDDLREF